MLPPASVASRVDGQPIDAVTVPTTNNPTPEISGRVDLAVPVIELVVGDDGAIRVSAEVDERGRFNVAVTQALPDGQHSLSINDLPVGSFSVDSAAQVTDESSQAKDETAQPRDRKPFLDIACVVPYPVDFGDSVPGSGSSMVAISHSRKKPPAPPRLRVRQPRNKCVTRSGDWVKPVGCSATRTDSRCQTRPIPRRSISRYRRLVVEYASGDLASAALATLAGADPGVD